MITIEFRYVDEFANEYKASTTIDPLGENELTLIGQQLNTFLRQVTYHRPNDYIYMEDLTEKELDLVEQYIWELRTRDEHELRKDGASLGDDDSAKSY